MSRVCLRFNSALLLIGVTAGFLACSPSTAFAGALKGLAEASNAQYRDIRNLGTKATPGQMMTVNRKHFVPALRALWEEHEQKWAGWRRAAKATLTETKEELAEILGQDPKTGQPLDGDEVGGGADGEKAADGAPAAKPNARAGLQAVEQAGAAGAKDVGFGGKREKKDDTPKVNNDGIIME